MSLDAVFGVARFYDKRNKVGTTKKCFNPFIEVVFNELEMSARLTAILECLF